MAKYRKKPVVVEAVQFTEAMAMGKDPLPARVIFGSRDIAEGLLMHHRHYMYDGVLNHQVRIGDWIVQDKHGPLSPAIFAQTYEPVEDKDD